RADVITYLNTKSDKPAELPKQAAAPAAEKKAEVIKDNAQIGLVATEFRDRMNFNTRPQRETPPDHRETFDRLAR
ncbi:MAG: hypothetical protein ABL897_04050, partial [Hyphomicrobium sp.]